MWFGHKRIPWSQQDGFSRECDLASPAASQGNQTKSLTINTHYIFTVKYTNLGRTDGLTELARNAALLSRRIPGTSQKPYVIIQYIKHCLQSVAALDDVETEFRMEFGFCTDNCQTPDLSATGRTTACSLPLCSPPSMSEAPKSLTYRLIISTGCV